MAIKEQDKVFYEELANGDKVINLPVTRANNVEGLGRSASTAYAVGDVVYVDNNKKVALKCIQEGTTSGNELDVGNVDIGSNINDGSVIWEVVLRVGGGSSGSNPTAFVKLETDQMFFDDGNNGRLWTYDIGSIIAQTNVTPKGFLIIGGMASDSDLNSNVIGSVDGLLTNTAISSTDDYTACNPLIRIRGEITVLNVSAIVWLPMVEGSTTLAIGMPGFWTNLGGVLVDHTVYMYI